MMTLVDQLPRGRLRVVFRARHDLGWLFGNRRPAAS
jgi:hypothetical protein